MKQLLVVSPALLFCASPAHPQQPTNPPAAQAGQDTASAELMTFTKAWTDAMNAKDRAKLEALVAPEFAFYRWDGALLY
jgi:hypothetical protein